MSRLAIFAAIVCVSAHPIEAQSTAVPITYSYNFDPDLSRDGAKMVFIKVLEGREQLFLAKADGQDEKQLTRDAVDHEDPAWSPDGSKVVYVRSDPQRKSLHIIDLTTGQDRQLTRFPLDPIHPSWTSDGKSILFCADDDLHPPQKNEAAIYRIDVASGRVTTVISGGTNTYPAPSPDGTRIAFRKMVDVNSEVFAADVDGRHQRNLTKHPAFEGWPSWSPDGTRLAFAANRNSSYQIFVMKADGSDVRLVANTEGRATAPKWSADGSKIVFPNCWRTGVKSACEILSAPVP